MGSFFAMLVALILAAEALPYIVAIVAIGAAVWIVRRVRALPVTVTIPPPDERAIEERALIDRMWSQHHAYLRGEERGIYGVAMPAVRQFQKMTK